MTGIEAIGEATIRRMVRRHTIEDRSSPVCMGVQRRIVSRDGHEGPWVCGTMSQVWKAYKRMRKANEKLSGGEAVRSDVLFGASVVRADGFRSDQRVNADEDMIRVTLDMPKHTWRRLQKHLSPNSVITSTGRTP